MSKPETIETLTDKYFFPFGKGYQNWENPKVIKLARKFEAHKFELSQSIKHLLKSKLPNTKTCPPTSIASMEEVLSKGESYQVGFQEGYNQAIQEIEQVIEDL